MVYGCLWCGLSLPICKENPCGTSLQSSSSSSHLGRNMYSESAFFQLNQKISGCPNPKMGMPPKSFVLHHFTIVGFSILTPRNLYLQTSPPHFPNILPKEPQGLVLPAWLSAVCGPWPHRGITTDQHIAAMMGPPKERTARFLVGYCWG